jgi:hypothetical protein
MYIKRIHFFEFCCASIIIDAINDGDLNTEARTECSGKTNSQGISYGVRLYWEHSWSLRIHKTGNVLLSFPRIDLNTEINIYRNRMTRGNNCFMGSKPFWGFVLPLWLLWPLFSQGGCNFLKLKLYSFRKLWTHYFSVFERRREETCKK